LVLAWYSTDVFSVGFKEPYNNAFNEQAV